MPRCAVRNLPKQEIRFPANASVLYAAFPVRIAVMGRTGALSRGQAEIGSDQTVETMRGTVPRGVGQSLIHR